MTDLFAELDLRTVGRATIPLYADIEGELTREDLESLQTEGGAKPEGIKRIRERHHALAKALVDGIPEGEAGIVCGYSASRVSILKADPTFRELMEYYKLGKEERYLELHDKIAGLGQDAVDELTVRLEDNPEDISIGQLLEISKMSLDRSGHGPSSSVEVNHKVGLADKLAAARKRALESKKNALLADESNIIDITPETSNE
jgi:hypothetical protein